MMLILILNLGLWCPCGRNTRWLVRLTHYSLCSGGRERGRHLSLEALSCEASPRGCPRTARDGLHLAVTAETYTT